MALALLSFGMLLWKKKYDIMRLVDLSRRDISSIAATTIIVFSFPGSPWIQSIPDSSSLNQLVIAATSKTYAHDSANNVSFVSKIRLLSSAGSVSLHILKHSISLMLMSETLSRKGSSY